MCLPFFVASAAADAAAAQSVAVTSAIAAAALVAADAAAAQAAASIAASAAAVASAIDVASAAFADAIRTKECDKNYLMLTDKRNAEGLILHATCKKWLLELM